MDKYAKTLNEIIDNDTEPIIIRSKDPGKLQYDLIRAGLSITIKSVDVKKDSILHHELGKEFQIIKK